MEDQNSIESLIGLELASVTFVRDYLQLGFDGPRITTVVDPVVYLGDRVLKCIDSGYRDGLCSLIGRAVERAWIVVDVEIRIEFSGAVAISIPIRPEDHIYGPEAVIFEDGSSHTWIW